MTPVQIALLIGFGIIIISEFFVFGLQRSTWKIAHANGLLWSEVGGALLPTWYAPVAWIIRILRWGVVIAMWILFSWKFALLLIVGHFLFMAIMPIPYYIYVPFLKSRYRKLINTNPIAAEAVAQMLRTCGVDPES